MSDSSSLANDSLSKTYSTINTQNTKQKYKRWSDEDEQRLKSLIRQKNKSISEFNDTDWSDLGNYFQVGPQQIFWKVKRLQEENSKKICKDANPAVDPQKISRKDMISSALV